MKSAILQRLILDQEKDSQKRIEYPELIKPFHKSHTELTDQETIVALIKSAHPEWSYRRISKALSTFSAPHHTTISRMIERVYEKYHLKNTTLQQYSERRNTDA